MDFIFKPTQSMIEKSEAEYFEKCRLESLKNMETTENVINKSIRDIEIRKSSISLEMRKAMFQISST